MVRGSSNCFPKFCGRTTADTPLSITPKAHRRDPTAWILDSHPRLVRPFRRGLARFYHRSPDQIRDDEIKAYLLHLLRIKKLAVSSLIVAVSALRFFFGRLEGKAALALQASFAISWLNTTGEKIIDPAYYPPVAPDSKPFTPVQLTQSGPDSQWKAMQQLYLFMIMSAKEKCYIQSPFFIPDESLLEAIKAAALSGVDVRIICTPRGGSYQLPYRAAHTYFADVARAGARVYMYQKGYFHAKTINIDTAVCAVGTANFDIRSFFLNYETMAVIYDEAVARELEEDFNNDLGWMLEWSSSPSAIKWTIRSVCP